MSTRPGRENQHPNAELSSSRKRFGTRSAHLHTGPRRVICRIVRPDTRQHLTACTEPTKNCLHQRGRPHTFSESTDAASKGPRHPQANVTRPNVPRQSPQRWTRTPSCESLDGRTRRAPRSPRCRPLASRSHEAREPAQDDAIRSLSPRPLVRPGRSTSRTPRTGTP